MIPSQLTYFYRNCTYFFSVINITCKYKRVLITFYAMVAQPVPVDFRKMVRKLECESCVCQAPGVGGVPGRPL